MLEKERVNTHITRIAAAVAATAMVSTALTGCVSVGSAAQKDVSRDAIGVYGDPATALDVPAVKPYAFCVSRTAPLELTGRGHIEAVSNCVVDQAESVVRIENVTREARIKIVPDAEDVLYNATRENGFSFAREDASDGSEVVVIPAGFSDKIKIEFVEPTPEEVVPVPETAPLPASTVRPSTAENTPVPDSRPAAEPAAAPAAAPAPVYEKFPGIVFDNTRRNVDGGTHAEYMNGIISNAHNMNEQELACAYDIFNAYNDFRVAHGLNTVAWSDDLANIAYATSIANSWHYDPNAPKHGLTHRLIIGEGLKYDISDILQYSSWLKSGHEAVERWSGSESHHRMMRCTSTQVAGVGVYYNADLGLWYYTIVYDFVLSGSNQYKGAL